MAVLPFLHACSSVPANEDIHSALSRELIWPLGRSGIILLNPSPYLIEKIGMSWENPEADPPWIRYELSPHRLYSLNYDQLTWVDLKELSQRGTVNQSSSWFVRWKKDEDPNQGLQAIALPFSSSNDPESEFRVDLVLEYTCRVISTGQESPVQYALLNTQSAGAILADKAVDRSVRYAVLGEDGYGNLPCKLRSMYSANPAR